MKKINGVCILTQDVPKLCRFYNEVLRAGITGDDKYAACTMSNGIVFSIFALKGMEEMVPGSTSGTGYGGCVLEFEVEDVDCEYERLVGLKILIVKPPTTQPWGLRSVWFRDPEGNIINFYARAKGGK